MTTLFFGTALRARLEREARAAYPRECCGLIEGVRDLDSLRVTALHQTRNVATDPEEFEIDPSEHVAALRAARLKGATLIGCYHSHPGGEASPSPRDRAGASETGFIWLIASLSTAGLVKFDAFVWHSDKFEPIAIESDDIASSSPA